MQVRCCSDTARAGWVKNTDCSVWGESDDWGGPLSALGCEWGKTFNQAKNICHKVNARLCTVAELEGDCTRGTG